MTKMPGNVTQSKGSNSKDQCHLLTHSMSLINLSQHFHFFIQVSIEVRLQELSLNEPSAMQRLRDCPPSAPVCPDSSRSTKSVVIQQETLHQFSFSYREARFCKLSSHGILNLKILQIPELCQHGDLALQQKMPHQVSCARRQSDTCALRAGNKIVCRLGRKDTKHSEFQVQN